MERLVAELAGLTRASASPGERAAARLVAARLRERGVQDVELTSFRYQGTYAYAHALHAAAGMLGGPAALAALVSLELEASGRLQWLRRLLPAGEGTNLVARVPAAGERRATVALVAHLDAARTGLAWHPRLVEANVDLARRRVRGFMGLTGLGLALSATRLRRAGRVLLAASILADLDIARSPTVPGANDNATGVAAVVELLAEGPRDGLELVGVFSGCEESGMGGMAAWLRDERPDFVVGLDTLGCGTPIVCRAEGTMLAHAYADEDVALVDGAEPWRIGGWTDPVLARFAGIPAVSILSRGPRGAFTNYHRMSDIPENVDWGSVEACLACARGLLDRLASRPWGRHAGAC